MGYHICNIFIATNHGPSNAELGWFLTDPATHWEISQAVVGLVQAAEGRWD